MPESKDSDFTWKDYQAKNNNELVSIVGNYVNRVFILTEKFFNKKVPNSSGKNESFIKEIDSLKRSIEISVANFKFREAMSYVIDVARLGNKYLTDNEPWKKYKEDPDFVSEVIYNSIQVVANLAILCEPFLPLTSNKIFESLNQTNNKSILNDGSQYNVFALPAESPIHGPRQLLLEPSNDLASPYGWHDTDGAEGPEYTITRGNNVWAREDIDGQGGQGYSPDGTYELTFDFELNFYNFV